MGDNGDVNDEGENASGESGRFRGGGMFEVLNSVQDGLTYWEIAGAVVLGSFRGE